MLFCGWAGFAGEYYDDDEWVTQEDFLARPDRMAGPTGRPVDLICQVNHAEPDQIVDVGDSGSFWL